MEPVSSSVAVSYTLRYSVERHEIWNWYWFYWSRRNGLWRFWVLQLFALLLAAWAISAALHFSTAQATFFAFSIYLLYIVFFVVFPQAHYKPNERTITINANGIETSRAGVATHRSWRDISTVVIRNDYIAMIVAGGISLWPLPIWIRIRTGNAFVIPNRAFHDNRGMSEFKHSIQEWHETQRQQFPRLARSRYYE
jgi:hypothetical protein